MPFLMLRAISFDMTGLVTEAAKSLLRATLGMVPVQVAGGAVIADCVGMPFFLAVEAL